MQRRIFMKTAVSLAVTGLAGVACTTAVTPTTTSRDSSPAATGKRQRELDAGIDTSLERLSSAVPDSRDLISKASGVLVFPSVLAAGLGLGGQYGEGALRIRNKIVEYYSLASVSVGLQIGAQSKAIVFLFMTQDALDKFRNSSGWSVGADASVAVVKVGANGMISTASVTGPVLAFVLTNTGLMANLTLEGTKISRLKL